MKKLFFCIFCLLTLSTSIFGQVADFSTQNYTPVTPSAFHFLKYTEMPVSEYTGIPNIAIPLYQIEEDGLKIPLDLTYHSVGLRVDQDASWVGLGWDLEVGSIIQTVNRTDDFGLDNLGHAITRMQPDYNLSPIPEDFPMRYQYPFTLDGPGWYSPYPNSGPNTYHSFKIATDYYVPVNGDFTQSRELLFDGQYWDSEPDIFRANFLGHSLNFVVDWSTNHIVVLNKQGYSITRNNDSSWAIIVPSGEQFYFEKRNIVTSTTVPGGANAGGTSTGVGSKIWYLTRIITKNKKQITLNYSSNGAYDNFPAYSENWVKDSLTNTVSLPYTDFDNGYLGMVLQNGITQNYSYMNESRIFLDSIVFPKGQVKFFKSAALDQLGEQKLDSISIQSTQLARSYKFNYSYYDTLTSPGNGFSISTEYSPIAALRLKLLSVKQNDGGIYAFTYNPNPLPRKNSFAQDFWGFYNGQTANTSLIPNPAKFNHASWGDNGNNHSVSPFYLQSGMLTAITYPTGGTVNFQYEPNQFNNYWVPDSASTSNMISSGDGLRIHAISFNPDPHTTAKKTIYSYDIGKAILPDTMFRQFNLNTAQFQAGGLCAIYTYAIEQINANGFFSSSMLGSINGVGYDTVTSAEIDGSGNSDGRTVSVFSNNPDIISNSAQGFSQLNANLPAIKNWVYPANGSPLTVFYYDRYNNLLKRKTNTYSNIQSNLYYGSRMFGYSNYIYSVNVPPNVSWNAKNQTLIGYYPIFDFETLLTGATTTEYAGLDSMVTAESFLYDSYDQVYSTAKQSPSYYEGHTYEYPYTGQYYHDGTSQTDLVNDHRLTEVVLHRTIKGRYPWQSSNVETDLKHYSIAHNSAVVETSMVLKKNQMLSNLLSDSVTYDLYDTTNANLLQYTAHSMTTSLLWDYNKEYLIAEIKNAAATNVAYTSFESTGHGNWVFTGTATADSTSPTGKYCYNLAQSSGSISILGLTSATGYIVSYWIKGTSPLSITGTQSGYPIQGKTINGWTYFEHKVTGLTSLAVSGSSYIDELRLYPSTAQMTTYTYNPLIGMTNSCDIDNRISYYFYDMIGRLKYIKDQDGNIIKTLDYHYQGQ